MRTDTRNRGIVVATLLLLLAIGGGIIYMHHRDSDNNNGDRSYAALAWQMDTITVKRPDLPVASPVATDAVDEPRPSGTVAAARYSVARRTPRRAHGRLVPEADKFSLVTSETYGGNMPLVPLTGETEADVTIQAEPTPPTVVAPAPSEAITVRKVPDSRRYGRVNLAPEIGGNINAFHNSRTSEMQTLGFHAGVMANVALGKSDHVALQPGLHYVMKGNKDKQVSYAEGVAITRTHDLTLNYIEMPVNAVYKFGDPGHARFMIGAGPYVSYLASSSDKVQMNAKNVANMTVAESKFTTANTGMKKWDAGGDGFIGVQLPGGFYATGGLELGVTDLQENPVDYSNADRSYDVFISIGYIIGPKGKEY